MQHETCNLPPRAFAEYLTGRFRVKPGLALCVALNQPDARNNHEAMEAWVAKVLAEGADDSTEQITRRLEQRFAEILMESGLIDGMLESFSFPLTLGQHALGRQGPDSARC